MNKIKAILSDNNVNSNESKMLSYLTVNDITVTCPVGHVTIESEGLTSYISVTTITAKAVTALAGELASGSTFAQIAEYLVHDCTNRKKLKLLSNVNTTKVKKSVKSDDSTIDSETYKQNTKKLIYECLSKIEYIVKSYGFYIDYQEDGELIFNNSECNKKYKELLSNEIVDKSILERLSTIDYDTLKKVGDCAYRLSLSDEMSLRALNNVELQLNMLDGVTVTSRNDNVINLIVMEVVR